MFGSDMYPPLGSNGQLNSFKCRYGGTSNVGVSSGTGYFGRFG